jgi:hypothetical protein
MFSYHWLCTSSADIRALSSRWALCFEIKSTKLKICSPAVRVFRCLQNNISSSIEFLFMYRATARCTTSSAKAVFPQVVMRDTHCSSYVNNLIFNLRAYFMNSPKPVSFESGIVSIMLLNFLPIIVSTSIRHFLNENLGNFAPFPSLSHTVLHLKWDLTCLLIDVTLTEYVYLAFVQFVWPTFKIFHGFAFIFICLDILAGVNDLSLTL